MILHRRDESTSETTYVCNGVQMECLAYYRLQDLHCCLCEKQPAGTTTHLVRELDINPDTDPSPELRNQVTADHVAEFSDMFDATVLQPMNSTPMIINLRNTVPFQLRRARPIPLAWKDQVKSELDSMYKKGIIAPMSSETSE